MIRSIIRKASHALPLESMIRWSGQHMLLPFYHAVYDQKPQPHIRHLYPIRSLVDFRNDLDTLLRYYEPVDLTYIMQYKSERRRSKKNVFHLSFDDGLRECYDIIAPELTKRGIPATFFINSDFVDNRNLFYRYKTSLILDTLASDKSLYQKLGEHIGIDSDEAIEQYVLGLGYQQTNEMDGMAERIGVDYKLFLKAQQPYLATEQIQALIKKGFTIGGHSHDHPRYTSISEEDQWQQTAKSIAYVRKNYHVDYSAFAFPFTDDGVSHAFFRRLQREKLVDVSFGTAGLKQEAFDFHFHRIPMEDSKGTAHQRLQQEYFYYLMKSIVKKNKIIRQ